MSDRDRLIELIHKADVNDSYECELCEKDDSACLLCQAAKIADYLLANGVVVLDTRIVTTKNRPLIQTVANMPLNDVLELVKSKQEERIIVPPCKVGDNIYFIERHPERLGGTKINTAEVLSIKANISHKDMTFWLFVTYRDINGNDTCGEILYGRTAFKTKEEAEAKLKELGK